MEKIDAVIGKGIRHYRWLQGMSQADLAAALGISEAQLRNHEAGKRRVSAAMLMAISGHLGVDASAFFLRNPDDARTKVRAEPAPARATSDGVQSGKYLAALMTHFQRLNDAQKQAVLQLVVSISKEDQAKQPNAAAPLVPEMAALGTGGIAGKIGRRAGESEFERSLAQTFGTEGRDGPY